MIETLVLKCSSCSAPLCLILKTNPLNQRQYIPIKQRLIAHCCHCGDKSWPVEIEGKIGVGKTEYSLPFLEPQEIIEGDSVRFDDTNLVVKTEPIKKWH